MTTRAFVIRDVTDPWRMRELEHVQQAAWGYPELEVLPATMLRISAATGGIVLAAYPADQEGAPAAGFAYGFPAWVNGELWHHSHLLAVHPDWRGSGMAVALKHAQRERALAQGLKRMTWTFDPLVTRNARLNLGKLGAKATEYRPDWYAMGTDSATAFPADRLLIEWDLTRPGIEKPAPAPAGVELLKANAEGRPEKQGAELNGETLLVEVPLQETHGPEKLAWRLALRDALSTALAHGYVVTDLAREPNRAYYVLTRP
ncbi:GNAT family N-acetyltransferase [Deinococcus cavernae]|nr:GNAT family N-acetyltransferase [Deinococcus cavernae]